MHDAMNLFVARMNVQTKNGATVVDTFHVEAEQFAGLAFLHPLTDEFRNALLFFAEPPGAMLSDTRLLFGNFLRHALQTPSISGQAAINWNGCTGHPGRFF